MLTRRRVVLAFGASTLAPFASFGQGPARNQIRIGVLSLYIPRERFLLLPAALRELGYEEGRNVVFDYQFAEGREYRLPGLAAELVARKADLIVAVFNAEILAAKRATSTIPIVMMLAMAPTDIGLVASLARPGGNVTGTTLQGPETAGKMLQLLRETVPRVTRVTILFEPDFPGIDLYLHATERAAVSMGIQLTLLPGRTVAELESAFTRIGQERPDALMIVVSGAIYTNRARVIEFAARQRLPALYTTKLPVTEGGLIAYGADQVALMRRTAAISDRILKGANPAELPVEQPTTFELVINMKTAKLLGLTIPQSILLRANTVIE